MAHGKGYLGTTQGPNEHFCIIPIGVAINTYMVQKVRFLIFCHLLLTS